MEDAFMACDRHVLTVEAIEEMKLILNGNDTTNDVNNFDNDR
jgi:hypothetical protein